MSMKKVLALATIGAWFVMAGISSTYAAALLTISGSSVEVTTDGVSAVNSSASALLTTAFEILKFLPVIALIIGWFFVLNKIFGIVKSAGGGWN